MRLKFWLGNFLLTIALLGASSVHAWADASDFYARTGQFCLVGGAVLGVGSILTAGAPMLVTLGWNGTVVSPWLAGTLAGCGAGGAASVVYSTLDWGYELWYGKPRYPLLYPALSEFDPDPLLMTPD